MSFQNYFEETSSGYTSRQPTLSSLFALSTDFAYSLQVGEKLGNKIAEFLEHGQIHQAQIISQSESYQTKRMFSQVHGIGWKTAEVLYQRGLRTLDDLERTGEYNLKYHADSLIKVGREEVESIKNFVQVQLDRMDEKKGSGVKAVITICGGYRRGKVLSNDIDLLITYPHSEDGYEKGVLEDLLRRLQSKGLIPPDGILSHSFPGTARITESNRPAALFDCLDKGETLFLSFPTAQLQVNLSLFLSAFVVFCHKRNGTTRMRDYYRRVDLIVTRWKSYGSALLGWTGSTQWERDIRKHGHAIGYNFGAGGE